MRLTSDAEVLKRMGAGGLQRAILERRNMIRQHRDQKGDDRCWLDDYLLYTFLDEFDSTPRQIPTDWPQRCEAFFTWRQVPHADPVPPAAILDPHEWNRDLRSMDREQLAEALIALQQAIRMHREAGPNRSVDDDRRLYAVLPEKMPADFRLPPREDFLGERKAPHAGCPAFWRSHANCPTNRHNFHVWGPCT